MPSTYTTRLRLTLPATGELTNTWGTTVNTGITELVDASIAGAATLSTWGGAGVPYTLSNNNGLADEARCMFIVAAGSPGENKNIICPAVSKLYVVKNEVAGGFSVTLKTASGSGVTVENGKTAILRCTGTDVVDAITQLPAFSLAGGTVNGVVYLNASKTLTTGSALTFDGTDLATTGGVRLNNAQYYYGKSAAGSAVRLLGVNAGNVNYVGSIDSGPTEVNYGAATTITAQYWSVGGSEAMRLTSTGLGIGTNNPQARVNIAGNDQSNVRLRFTNTGGSGRSYELVGGYPGTNNSNFSIFDATASTIPFSIEAATPTNTLLLNASGNLGIGTSSPGYKLDVNGVGRVTTEVRVKNTAGNVSYLTFEENGNGNSATFISGDARTTGNMGFWTNSTERMRLDSSGNLGIGTSSPATKLHVNTGAAGYGITVAALSQTSRTYQLGIDSNSNFAIYESVAAAQRVVLDQSGNLGLGVTPSAWTALTTQQISYGSVAATTSEIDVSHNAYYSSTGWKYIANGYATNHYQSSGAYIWRTAASGTAGNPISFTQAMTLDASGNLLVGTTSTGADGLGIRNTLNLTFAEGSGTSYANLFRQTSSGATVIANGYKWSNTANGFASSIGTSWAKTAIGLGVGTGAITFYTDSAGTVANGTDVTPSERARITSAGDFIHQVNGTAPSLSTNGTMSFELTSNTSLKIVVRGTDGVTRSTTLTLT